MKRLLAAGYDRIFQICHCWRYEERGRRHLPEFTMLEWYRSYCDYRALMSECERLFSSLADILGSGNALQYQGTAISLAPPWQRLTVREAFRLYGGIPMEKALSQGLFDEVMSFAIEPRLGWVTPTFLHDYPAELGALARLKPDDPSVAERFELYLGGMEIANAFSELTDQDEQRQRFMAENALRQAAGKQCYPLPEKFLAALADLPPSAGIALGVDRLIMLFLDKTEISSVIAFSPEDL
jgi:lysyl-tRNA synthetase class 2